jgi:hypothetical protein
LERRYFTALQHIATFTCVTPYPQAVALLGTTYGPFRQGQAYQLPLWAGKILVQTGHLQLTEGLPGDVQLVKKRIFEESTGQVIFELEPDVLLDMIVSTRVLFELDVTPNGRNGKYRQYITSLTDLIKVRLSKILRLVMHEQGSQTKRKLAQEERILFDQISPTIMEWLQFFTRIENC